MHSMYSVDIPRSVGYRKQDDAGFVSGVRHDGLHHDDTLL
jgi:hypothetical protein